MNIFYNIAYGSNLHPVRLTKRCRSARVIGISSRIEWKIVFHKQSDDGSAKCNAVNTGESNDTLWVAVYEIPLNEKAELDKAEGLGKGYHEETINVTIDGNEYNGLIYLADKDAVDDTLIPYNWYKDMVFEGAKYHRFPDDYINLIQEVECIQDKDIKRARRNLIIVDEMKSFNDPHSERENI